MAIVASVHACLHNVQKSPIFFRETLFFRASVFSKIKFKNLFNRQWIYYFLALSRTTKSILRFSIGVLSCVKIALHEETIGLGTSDGSNNTPSKQCTYCVGIFTFTCDEFFGFDRPGTIATNEEADFNVSV